jgi:prevent-host-death family protein
MAKKFTVAEAKARFAECLRDAEEGRTVLITRHGRDVAAVVSLLDYEQVQRLRSAGPEAGLASLAGGWKGSDKLADELGRIRWSSPRRTPKLAR